jgi:hypothetical protein
VKAEPGRNDLCPCGSGKKYKKCCLPRVKGFAVPAVPLEGEPRNSHLEMGPDGQWIEKPGSLWMQVHVEEAEPPDAHVRDAFSSYRMRLQGRTDLQERLRDCVHKCRAVDYHRRTIHAEIDRKIETYAGKPHGAQSGAAFVRRDEVLLYETEAFLFQSKSAVDALVRALAPVVPSLFGFDMFRGKGPVAGGAVLDALRENEAELCSLFDAARGQWIQELKELRDTITHVSELEGFTSFVENQYHGGPDATIDLPKMPSGVRVDTYCDDILDHLMDLTTATWDEIVLRLDDQATRSGV